MINRVNLSTPIKPAFKGEKEVERLVNRANSIPPGPFQDTNDITNFFTDMQRGLKDGRLSQEDIDRAQDKVDGWRKNLF